jgi:hypothetical protein
MVPLLAMCLAAAATPALSVGGICCCVLQHLIHSSIQLIRVPAVNHPEHCLQGFNVLTAAGSCMLLLSPETCPQQLYGCCLHPAGILLHLLQEIQQQWLQLGVTRYLVAQ